MLPLAKECPDCHSTLSANATYCGCGWGRRPKGNGKSAPSLSCGVERCAWISNGVRCAYPGTTWRQPYGAQRGQGYCRFHAHEDCSAAYGAEVVRESNEGVAPKVERMRACQARDCPITTRALPGKDFCEQHELEFVRDPDSVRRAGLPSNIRKMLRHLET